MLYLSDYRDRDQDGNNWTPAFNRAIARAAQLGQAIRFPAGWLEFHQPPDPMGAGITLEGDSGITSAKTGTCCVAAYTELDPEEGFFTWDGSDERTYKGTGGGIRNMTIYKFGDGKHSPIGGTAIRLRCVDGNKFRAGWWILQNVAVLSEDSRKLSVWDHIFVADGLNVPRHEGIRQIWLNNFLCSGARSHVVDLRNVRHMKWNLGEIQAGPTQDPHTAPAGLRITGPDSQNHFYSGVGCWDTLDIQDCREFAYYGKAQWLQIGKKCRRGIIQVFGCDKWTNDAPANAVFLTAI